MTSDPITAAAMWLAEEKEPHPNIIPLIREKFFLTATQAAQACTLANKFRTYRRAHG